MATMTTKSGKSFSPGAIVWKVLEYFILIFFSLVAVIPVITCAMMAFKTKDEYLSKSAMSLPENWLNFDNFIEAFQKADMHLSIPLSY